MRLSKNLTVLVLLFIILVGFLLRFVNIVSNPPALYGDELTMVEDIYSILKTGHDQTGEFLPITFKMGAGRPGGYIYFSLPFVALFGPTALGERSLSIISGVGLIILMYLLGEKLYSKKYGLTAAFLTAISLWDINLSRGGFEAHFALFLALLGTYLFLLSFKKPWYVILSAVCFGLTIHTYPTYKLVLPLFLLILFWYVGIKECFKKLKYKSFIAAVLIFVLFVLIAFIQFFSANSEKRFFSINIFSQQDLKQQLIQKIDLQRSIATGPTKLVPLFSNQYEEYGKLALQSYLKNFSIEYLFINGDGNPRHNMTQSGVLYYVELFTIILGLIFMFLKNKRLFKFLLVWILIAPLATTLLGEQHSLRNDFMLPPLILFSAAGFFYIYNNSSNMAHNLIKIVLATGLLMQFIGASYQLFFISPAQFGSFWSVPARSATSFAIENKSKYDFVILSDNIDNIEYAVPVYGKYPPQDVIKQYNSPLKVGSLTFKKYDNIYIGHVPESQINSFLNSLPGKSIFIQSNQIGKKPDIIVVEK